LKKNKEFEEENVQGGEKTSGETGQYAPKKRFTRMTDEE